MLIESTDADVQINLKDADSSDGISIGCDQDDFYVRTGLTVERLRITSTGYVGINETAPSNRLHVKETNSNTIVGKIER